MNKLTFIIFILLNCSAFAQQELRFCRVKQEGPLSTQFLTMIKQVFAADCFVETGTFGGDTTLKAAAIFPRVHTIELLPRYFEQNKPKFSSYPNITAHFGDSGAVLTYIVKDLGATRCVFFLDAHYAGEDTAKGDGNTPLIAEIRAICSAATSNIIIIDDIRLCQSNQHIIDKQHTLHPEETTVFGYPSLTHIAQELKRFNTTYELYVFGDVGLAIPMDAYPDLTMSPIIKAMTVSRLFEEKSPHTTEQIRHMLQLEQYIVKAHADEIKALFDLVDFMQPELFTPHYKLWMGLALLGQGAADKALTMLRKAYSAGLNHWRVAYYICRAMEKAGNPQQARLMLQEIGASVQQDGLSISDLSTI